jgi:hypothetical protein
MQNAKCNAPRPLAFAILHFALLCFVLSASVAAEIIDRVLAVAAGELIMLSDVTAARDLGLVTIAPGGDPVNQIGPILSKLIDRELVLAEVERYAPPEPTADAVDREMAQVRARFATPQAFDAALLRSGIDENHLRQTLREDLRIVAYEDQRFTVAPPSEDELARYYRDHPDVFRRQGQVVPFEAARQDVTRAVTGERRNALIADWVAGLRRRGDVIDLYLPGAPAQSKEPPAAAPRRPSTRR